MILNLFDEVNPDDSTLIQKLSNIENNIDKIFTTLIGKKNSETLKSANINIVFCDKKTIIELNKAYRGINSETDVLTFNNDTFETDNSNLFSEIYISIPTATKQAKERGHSLLSEIIILIVHGLVHSTGLDHETSELDEIKFKEKENKILELLGKNQQQGLIELS